MARRKGGLPKWAIKQAGGINKKAWRLARRGRRKKASRKKAPKRRRRASAKRGNPGNKKMGPFGILSKIRMAILAAAPALGSIAQHGFSRLTLSGAVTRYTGYNLDSQRFQPSTAKTSAIFYGTWLGTRALHTRLLKTPQLAGRKKVLAMLASVLPEIAAAPALAAGNTKGALNAYTAANAGYWPVQHQDWISHGGAIRSQFLSTLTGQVALVVASRVASAVGINKMLPKGINL